MATVNFDAETWIAVFDVWVFQRKRGGRVDKSMNGMQWPMAGQQMETGKFDEIALN